MRLKRFTAAALAAVMCAFSLPVSAADFAEKTSDIKAYTYNITDATTIQRIAAGLKAPTEKEQNIYDLDFSGEIDIVDATIVQMHCARYYDVRSDDYLNQFATEEPTEPTTADPIEPTTAEPTEPTTAEPTEPTTAVPTTAEPTTEAVYLRISEENVEMGLNESYTFTVETNAPSVTFMSTDESVLTVDENGTVTPKSTGEASVACDTGKGVTAWCDFKICSEAKEIKLNQSSLDLGSEEYYTFRSFVDADAAAFKRMYSSDNENVMKIDSVTGYATAIGAGKATISCTLANGLSDSCEVTVYRMAQGLTLNESSVTLALGDSFDFDSHVAGGGFAYIRVYHSLDESVVSIAPGGGIATAVGEGETQIYCELINGVRAYADVKVLPASERIKLSNAPSLMQVGEKARFRVDGNTAVNNANITVTSVNGLVRATEQDSDFIELTGIRQGADTVTVTTYNGLSASFNVTVDGSCATLIDVSTWQGNIDFNKVKLSGIDYVILRAGYGRELDQIDNRFVENYEKAKAAGLKVGAYWFSYSESVDEAFKEAEACLYCLGGRKLDMPLYYDLEIDSVMERMTKSEYTQMALNFCSVIESAGYRPGIYSSVSVYQTKLDHSRFLRDGISVWNAHWSSKCTIECDVWQYSENGSVSGIYGDVDMNLIYNLDVAE